uniref:Death domain-containing protein n=1 Tax=Amphimedon queenslandica TaxID=400682 RepID=A0A1X7UHH7_AMPQE
MRLTCTWNLSRVRTLLARKVWTRKWNNKFIPYYYLGYDFNLGSLKEIIKNPKLTAKVKPALISFLGIPPDSGQTEAVQHILDRYIDKVTPTFASTPGRVGEDVTKAEGIEYHELVATGFKSVRNLYIGEVTEESSSAFGILSAFRQGLIEEKKLPLFNIYAKPSQGFKNKLLSEHLIHTYHYLREQESIPKRDQKSVKDVEELSEKDQEYAKKLKRLLPEGIALVIMWDVALNKSVFHFLTALRGHLYNCHSWLFLDLQQDLEKLHLPPEIPPILSNRDGREIKDATLLIKWRPRLHYLIRSCRLGETKEKKRRRVCTVFAKHDGTFNGRMEEKMDELERKVQVTARHIGVTSLLKEKIVPVNLCSAGQMDDDCLLRLNQELQHVICEVSYEDIPIAWIFLRSLFYRNEKCVITKKELEKMAKECGMNESSFTGFCKFYTSFGSIFDLSLVDEKCQTVAVKPMAFLQLLDCLLYPSEELRKKYPMISYGIYPEDVCREVFNAADWSLFMDALISLSLATKVSAQLIEAPADVLLNCNTTYYFISLSRTDEFDDVPHPHSIHIITSINTPHVFRQVTVTKHLLDMLKAPKLIPCKYFDRTIIKDTSTGTTITIVSHSPATRLDLDKPNSEVCGCIVRAYNKIADTCNVTVKYKFVRLCAAEDFSKVQSIPSSLYHILPDNELCSKCKEPENDDSDLLQAWNKALTENEIKGIFKPTGDIKATELADIADRIASVVQEYEMDIRVVAKALLGEEHKEEFQGIRSDKRINGLILFWYQNQLSQEPRRDFAKKLSELGDKLIDDTKAKLSIDKQEEFEKIVKSKFENMAQELDAYYYH